MPIRTIPLPSQTILCALLYVDETSISGLRWKVSPRNQRRAGDVAGSLGGTQRWSTEINGISYLNHRLIWKITFGSDPKEELDHKNRNHQDNRPNALREASHSQNGMNRKLASNNKSGTAGVSWNTSERKWEATGSENNKRVHLGRFEKLNSAIQARQEWEIKHQGEFRRID